MRTGVAGSNNLERTATGPRRLELDSFLSANREASQAINPNFESSQPTAQIPFVQGSVADNIFNSPATATNLFALGNNSSNSTQPQSAPANPAAMQQSLVDPRLFDSSGSPMGMPEPLALSTECVPDISQPSGMLQQGSNPPAKKQRRKGPGQMEKDRKRSLVQVTLLRIFNEATGQAYQQMPTVKAANTILRNVQKRWVLPETLKTSNIYNKKKELALVNLFYDALMTREIEIVAMEAADSLPPDTLSQNPCSVVDA